MCATMTMLWQGDHRVQSADHPTDGQIVALARKFFKAADRMIG